MPDYLRLTATGSWESSEGPDIRDGDDYFGRLKELGWDEFLSMGDEGYIGVKIRAFQHVGRQGQAPEGRSYPFDQYLITVGGPDITGVGLLVSGLPDLMNTLSTWAPVVQAAAISGLGHEASFGSQPDHDGLVETITRRWSPAECWRPLRHHEVPRRALDSGRACRHRDNPAVTVHRHGGRSLVSGRRRDLEGDLKVVRRCRWMGSAEEATDLAAISRRRAGAGTAGG